MDQWLATIEPIDDYYRERQVNVPKAVLTVREGETFVPLLNAAWQEAQEVELPQEMGRLRVKALEEVYEKRVLDDSKECEHQVFSLR